MAEITTNVGALIPINESNGKKAVNARALHVFLGSKQKFADWIKNRIEKCDLIENVDYVTASENYETANGGYSTRTEYALTIQSAKEISMVEGNEKGKLFMQEKGCRDNQDPRRSMGQRERISGRDT